MATVGRPKRKRKRGAGTGVKVKPHVRTPRGPNTVGGKKKRPVRVDPYQRGKPARKKNKRTADVSSGRRKRRKRRT